MDGRTFLGLEATEHPHHWRLPVVPRLSTTGGFLFGGCGLAAGCEAMELTTLRPTVWATAQYLAFARPPSAVDIEVVESVTGSVTSQARAIGRVDGAEIFTVNAAMGLRAHELEGQWAEFPTVPPPDECGPREHRFDPAHTVMGTMDLRVAKARPASDFPGPPGDGRTVMWARFEELAMSTTAVAILGDLVAFGVSQAVGDWAHSTSLDNTVRIVRLIPSEWIMVDIRVHGVANGYGHGNLHLWTESGELLATASQSTIARRPVWARGEDPPDRT